MSMQQQQRIESACAPDEGWREDSSCESSSEDKIGDGFGGVKDKMEDSSSCSESEASCEPVAVAPRCPPGSQVYVAKQVPQQMTAEPVQKQASIGASLPTTKTQRSSSNVSRTKLKEKKDEKKLTKTLNIEIIASPRLLAADTNETVWSLAEGVGHKFKREKRTRVNNKIKAEMVGNHKKAVVHSIRAKSGANSFGFTIGLTIPGIQGSHMSKDGKHALITIKPGQSINSEQGQLMHVNESAEDPTMKKFSNLSHEQIDQQYQPTLGSDETYDVLTKSEICKAVMNRKNKILYEKYKNMDASQPVVKMDRDDVDQIVQQLKNLVGDLPVVNLEDFKAQIVRMDGKSWDDTSKIVGMFDSSNEREKDMVLKRNELFNIDLELEYTLPDN